MPNVHPSAIVSSHATLAENVSIAPYALIECNVQIGEGSIVGSHSVIRANVRIGANNQIGDHVVLGGAPQDISCHEEETWLEIGDGNSIREYCSIHRSTNTERPTRIGSNNYIMCNSHIGHDCQIGNGVIITSYAGISGHVEIGDKAVVGGHVGIHQFCRIGALAMVGAFTPIGKDVLPYCLLGRDPVAHYRLNKIGLRRAGITGERYRLLEKGIEKIRNGEQDLLTADTQELQELISWLAAKSKRGVYKFVR